MAWIQALSPGNYGGIRRARRVRLIQGNQYEDFALSAVNTSNVCLKWESQSALCSSSESSGMPSSRNLKGLFGLVKPMRPGKFEMRATERTVPAFAGLGLHGR